MPVMVKWLKIKGLNVRRVPRPFEPCNCQMPLFLKSGLQGVVRGNIVAIFISFILGITNG
jgi:hypothetical protein